MAQKMVYYKEGRDEAVGEKTVENSLKSLKG